jgi:hypothetical protein
MTIKKIRSLMNNKPVLNSFFPICFCPFPWNDKNSIFQKGVSLVLPKVPKVSKKRLDKTVCVVGLGYVGLPLAEDFSEHLRTI